jgi:hypothetical protein
MYVVCRAHAAPTGLLTPWRKVPLEKITVFWITLSELHDFTTHKIVFFIVTVVRTSNPRS